MCAAVRAWVGARGCGIQLRTGKNGGAAPAWARVASEVAVQVDVAENRPSGRHHVSLEDGWGGKSHACAVWQAGWESRRVGGRRR